MKDQITVATLTEKHIGADPRMSIVSDKLLIGVSIGVIQEYLV
jgi:hypothetical protein